jgi:hypothetical protein
MTRPRSFAYGLPLVLAASVGQSALADASTIDLSCHQIGATSAYGLNVSIDLSARTASAWVTGFTRSQAPTGPATIGSDQVTWANVVSGATSEYELDRRNGTLTERSPGVTISWTCKKDKPVF